MRKIRIFVVLLALVLVAAACGTDEPVAEEPAAEEPAAEEPAEEEEPLRIGLVLPDLAIPIFQIMVEAAEARAEELGVILLSTGTSDPTEQANAIANYLAAGVDAIGFDSIDAGAIDAPVNDAHNAGIPVVSVISGVDEQSADAVVTHINIPGLDIGRGMGEAIVEWCEGKDPCKVSHLQGSLADATGFLYQLGAYEILDEYEHIEIVCEVETLYDATAALNATQDCLTANPDLDFIFVWWDLGASAAVEAVREAGKLGEIGISGGGGACPNLVALLAGEQYHAAMIPGQALGVLFVDTVVGILNGESFPEEIDGPHVSLTTPLAEAILDGDVEAPEDYVIPLLEEAIAGC